MLKEWFPRDSHFVITNDPLYTDKWPHEKCSHYCELPLER